MVVEEDSPEERELEVDRVVNVNEGMNEVPVPVPVPTQEEDPVGEGAPDTVAVMDGLGVHGAPVEGIEAQGLVSVCWGQFVGCWDWEGSRMGGSWESLDSDSDSDSRSVLPVVVVEAVLELDWSLGPELPPTALNCSDCARMPSFWGTLDTRFIW